MNIVILIIINIIYIYIYVYILYQILYQIVLHSLNIVIPIRKEKTAQLQTHKITNRISKQIKQNTNT